RRLPLRRRALRLVPGDAAQAALQVVENEADRRPRGRRRGDRAAAVAGDEDATSERRRLELRQGLPRPGPDAAGRGEELLRGTCDPGRTVLVGERRSGHGTAVVEEDGGLDLRGDLRQI